MWMTKFDFTREEYSEVAQQIHLTTKSSWLNMKLKLHRMCMETMCTKPFGLQETHGENNGEIMVTLHLKVQHLEVQHMVGFNVVLPMSKLKEGF